MCSHLSMMFHCKHYWNEYTQLSNCTKCIPSTFNLLHNISRMKKHYNFSNTLIIHSIQIRCSCKINYNSYRILITKHKVAEHIAVNILLNHLKEISLDKHNQHSCINHFNNWCFFMCNSNLNTRNNSRLHKWRMIMDIWSCKQLMIHSILQKAHSPHILHIFNNFHLVLK